MAASSAELFRALGWSRVWQTSPSLPSVIVVLLCAYVLHNVQFAPHSIFTLCPSCVSYLTRCRRALLTRNNKKKQALSSRPQLLHGCLASRCAEAVALRCVTCSGASKDWPCASDAAAVSLCVVRAVRGKGGKNPLPDRLVADLRARLTEVHMHTPTASTNHGAGVYGDSFPQI